MSDTAYRREIDNIIEAGLFYQAEGLVATKSLLSAIDKSLRGLQAASKYFIISEAVARAWCSSSVAKASFSRIKRMYIFHVVFAKIFHLLSNIF